MDGARWRSFRYSTTNLRSSPLQARLYGEMNGMDVVGFNVQHSCVGFVLKVTVFM
ncbi:hypothetical protein TorRG33x02_155950 [Trema orientale]|uniref:Uncharacterized protein n=1 Tax=Trema orientale TaxID=63057 RepID=A0A2P5ET25_TREOI|nr:hypothetical protein TorRG33x02_155950 [Trema orientale]